MNVRWIVGCKSGNPELEILKFWECNESKIIVFLNRQNLAKRSHVVKIYEPTEGSSTKLIFWINNLFFFLPLSKIDQTNKRKKKPKNLIFSDHSKITVSIFMKYI